MNRSAAASEFLLVAVALSAGCGGRVQMTELQRVKSEMLDVVLLSPHDALRHGNDTFIIEFRSNGQLVDVGTVRATAGMPMAGTPMFGTIDVQRTDIAGRYAASGQFDMAGTWRTTVEWDGPAGHGSITFSGTVH